MCTRFQVPSAIRNKVHTVRYLTNSMVALILRHLVRLHAEPCGLRRHLAEEDQLHQPRRHCMWPYSVIEHMRGVRYRSQYEHLISLLCKRKYFPQHKDSIKRLQKVSTAQSSFTVFRCFFVSYQTLVPTVHANARRSASVCYASTTSNDHTDGLSGWPVDR